jgi:hypothetical protein
MKPIFFTATGRFPNPKLYIPLHIVTGVISIGSYSVISRLDSLGELKYLIFALVFFIFLRVRRLFSTQLVSVRKGEDNNQVLISGWFSERRLGLQDNYLVRSVANDGERVEFEISNSNLADTVSINTNYFDQLSLEIICKSINLFIADNQSELDSIKSLKKMDGSKSILYSMAEKPSAIKIEWACFAFVIGSFLAANYALG